MLLILLALLSSIALLVGAVSAVQEHVVGHTFVTVTLALVLAAVNFFSIQRAGLGVAAVARGKTEAVQARYGKVFSLAVLIWTICAGFLGFWISRFVSTLP